MVKIFKTICYRKLWQRLKKFLIIKKLPKEKIWENIVLKFKSEFTIAKNYKRERKNTEYAKEQSRPMAIRV